MRELSSNDDIFIKRCFQLAEKGRGKTKTNPMVGAVLVKNNIIISEGYHKKYGQDHAEVDCIKRVPENFDYNNSKLYVSLEPCCHHGKTPPCTDLILEKKIPEVIIGSEDFNPVVKSKGIKKLRNNNVNVRVLNNNEYQKKLNIIFYILQKYKRPMVSVKFAESKDKYIGRLGEKVKISNLDSDIYGHKLRAESDVILVGKNTWNNDKPSLDTRHFTGESPDIAIISSHPIDTPKNSTRKIINFNLTRNNENNIKYLKVNTLNVKSILSKLYDLGYSNVLVEGGKKVIEAFTNENLIDKLMIISSNKFLNNGISAPEINSNNFVKTYTISVNSDIITFYTCKNHI